MPIDFQALVRNVSIWFTQSPCLLPNYEQSQKAIYHCHLQHRQIQSNPNRIIPSPLLHPSSTFPWDVELVIIYFADKQIEPLKLQKSLSTSNIV